MASGPVKIEIKTVILRISIGFRWWVRPYLNSLVLFCMATGLRPDIEKVSEFLVKYGVRVSMEG